MIARNFVEGRANLFYPVIDIAGEKTGIIGTEFPFLIISFIWFRRYLGMPTGTVEGLI